MTSDDIIPLLRKSAEDLTKAVGQLGDKATWSPLGKGRTAGNQVAECALLSGAAAEVIQAGIFPPFDFEKFMATVAELGNTPDKALALLAENTEKLCAELGNTSAEKLQTVITMPWGNQMTLEGVAMMTYWNNSYHHGQVVYISTLAAE